MNASCTVARSPTSVACAALAAAARRVVVGGGIIGSEMAASLSANGAAVTMLFPEEEICARAFPPDLARLITEYCRDKGVTIWSREKLAQLTPRADGVALRTLGGQATVADLVVAGIGIAPSAELAQMAGLDVGDGIQVDAGLRTSDPAIWAAGDVASFVSPALEKRVRVEHEDDALTMGRLAGRAMAGDAATYHHLPFFYSDLFDLGYEAVGELDARHEVACDWRQPFREGIVFLLARGRVRGVLLWNVWGRSRLRGRSSGTSGLPRAEARSPCPTSPKRRRPPDSGPPVSCSTAQRPTRYDHRIRWLGNSLGPSSRGSTAILRAMADLNRPCFACRIVAGELRPAGGIIWRGDGLTVHGLADPCPIPGWLVLTSDRHARALYDLEPGELTAVGPVAARVMRAQRAALGAQHVYAFSICDELLHFHLHLVPRFADTPQRLRARGCFDARPEDALPAWRIVGAAEAVRRAMGSS